MELLNEHHGVVAANLSADGESSSIKSPPLR